MVLSNKRTFGLAVMIACLVIGLGLYAAFRIPSIRASRQSVISADGSFLQKHCVDEHGQVLTDVDGLVQNKCIDHKAWIARNNDPGAILELTKTIFSFSGVSAVPEGVLNQFEERLVRSELKYRLERKDGISDDDIVRGVNNLATKLHAPNYAMAYSSEVRLLREDSRSGLPHFISPENQPMSPLEATYMAERLIYQKILNETFLLTPEERASVESKKAPGERPIELGSPYQVAVPPRVKEMMAFARETGAMNHTRLIEMGHQLLDDLGIER
jgi:hypothetical protein